MDEQVREDMACLIDSPYRGPLLVELRNGTVKQSELKTMVGASQATVSRALSTFEDRGWISKTGRTYRLTRLGRLVADAFDALETTMTTARELRGVIEHIPLDEMGFEISQLRGATVIRPTQADPLRPLRHATEFLDGADSVVMLSHAFSPGSVEIIDQRASMGEPTTVVVTTDVVEALIEETSYRSRLHDAVADGLLDIWEFEGRIPYILAIADDTVSFGIDNDAGHPIAIIDTDNDVVHQWATDTVEQYRTKATKLNADRFS